MRSRGAAIAAAVLLAAGILASLSVRPVRGSAQDDAVTLGIGNDGAQALRCVVLFGHWMSLELGVIDVGAVRDVAMMRDSRDGSLYVLREDGRKMMIENVVCGSDAAWAETLGQVPLLPVRESGERALRTSCRADGRVTCTPPTAP